MNVLFLSPHFPPHYYLFCRKLRELGATVLGLGEEHPDALRPELSEALSDYYRVNCMDDYEQVYRAIGYLLHNNGRIGKVESLNEHWLQMESTIRTDFNIPGLKPSDMEGVKRKSIMKKLFMEAGAPVARGEKFRSPEETREFAKKVGFPVFAKPDIGVGANCTFKINNEKELERFFREKPHDDYILEEFVDGYLATFDGLTDSRGNLVLSVSHFSETGVFEVLQDDADLSFYSLNEIPEDLKEHGTKIIKAFGLRGKFFHLEFLRRRTDNSIIAMELNMRPPGGFITDMMNFTCDVDVYLEWARIMLGMEPTRHIKSKFFTAHIARKYGKHYRRSHDEILQTYGEKIRMFTEVSPIFSRVMGNFVYIVRSTSLDDIKEMIPFIQELGN